MNQTQMARTPDNQRGMSLLELVFSLGVAATIAAVALPMTSGSLDFFRLSGDARGVSNSMAVAKMRAAAHFTQARVFVDVSDGAYRVENWDKDTAAWTGASGWTSLSPSVAFGFGAFEEPPPNTQAAIGQAPLCKDDDGANIAGTACIVFNSRGVPVDSTGAPTAADALYVESGSAVYAATVSATGLIRLWRADSEADGVWVQH
jgi:type II secretory pathway pseudopilin PulG